MPTKKAVNARKRRIGKPLLGQHFLRDAGAAEKIVAALGALEDSTVIEIGAGRGALTAQLAAKARRLIAIELDRTLSAQLRMEFARYPNVEIIEGDVLRVDFANLIARRPAPLMSHSIGVAGEEHERARVTGNLPYYITSDILLRLLAAHEWIDRIVIMVQREVAARIAAQPGSRDYGLLSATVQLYARADNLFTLPPAAFSPPPKVHSSVVRLTIAPQASAFGVDANEFVEFLKQAFAQKRKTLANNLKLHYPLPQLARALAAARVSPQSRAEALSLAQMARIYQGLHSKR